MSPTRVFWNSGDGGQKDLKDQKDMTFQFINNNSDVYLIGTSQLRGVSSDEILKCYTKNDDLTNALYDAMEAFIAGNSETGNKKMKESKPLWNTAMAGCGEIAKKMSEISDKMDRIQKRSDWNQVSKKVYEAQKHEIDDDISHEYKQWAKGNFYSAGA